MNNHLKKEIIKNTFIVGIILLFASISTYFIYNKFQTTRNVDYNSKSLDIVYHDNGNKITIDKVTPMTDSVGLSSKSYNLSIKNNLTVPVDYKVRVLDDSELDIEDEDNLIPKEDIRISIKEGKNQLVISLGCTGGQHRSVYCAEKLAAHLSEKFDIKITVSHRELDIEKIL